MATLLAVLLLLAGCAVAGALIMRLVRIVARIDRLKAALAANDEQLRDAYDPPAAPGSSGLE